MKKINNLFLHQFYESYSFLTTKNLYTSRGLLYTQINNWFLLDSYLHIKNFKQIILLLTKLVNEKKKNNKVLFILDHNVYYFFNKTFGQHHFISTDVKGGLRFLQQSSYSANIACVIYIGQTSGISKKSLRQLNIPFISFSSKPQLNYDYFSYNMLSFHGSMLYLKLILKSILLPKKFINEKKDLQKL